MTYLLMMRTFSKNVYRMLAAQAFYGMAYGIFMVLLNLYLKEAGFDEGTIGRILACQALSAALSSIPWGRFADQTSRRLTFCCGLMILGLGFLFILLSIEPWWIYVSAIIGGAGNGALLVSVLPFLQENSRRRQRTYLFSLSFSLTLFAEIIAGILAGYLPGFFERVLPSLATSHLESFRLTLWLGVFCMALALIPAVMIDGTLSQRPGNKNLPEGSPQDHQDISMPWGLLSRFILTTSLVGLGAGLIVPYFNLYFRDWAKADVIHIGAVFSLGQIGMVTGGLLTPLISRRMSPAWGVAATQMASLPFMLIMAWRHELWVCAACFIFRGTFMNMGVPLRQELLMSSIGPRFRARASALDSMSWNLAWAVSMIFSGELIKSSGYQTCLYLTFSLYLISGILFWWFFHNPVTPKFCK